MRPCCFDLPVALLIGSLALVQPALAEGLRDPTIPPFWSPEQAPATSGHGVQPPMSVISVNGKLHLMVGTRLYAPGQKVGESVIEQISETEVWFREGRTLRKVSNFVGVKRKEVTGMAVLPVR